MGEKSWKSVMGWAFVRTDKFQLVIDKIARLRKVQREVDERMDVNDRAQALLDRDVACLRGRIDEVSDRLPSPKRRASQKRRRKQ